MKLKIVKYKGIQNDNYNANAYALKCMYISFAVLFFSYILDVLNIFIVDLNIMTVSTIGAGILCFISLLYAFFIGIDSSSSRYIVMFLLVSMATVICTGLAYHTTMFMMFPIVCSAQYFDRKISFFTAISTCAGIAVSVMLGYRIGLCDSNMLLLTYTNSATHIAKLVSGDFTINYDKSLMFLFFVFPRWLIVLAMMPLLNHVARDIQVRTAREAMARHLAEVDGLTGIYNRTKYLQAISTYYPTLEEVSVLFFDINNLKEVNDNKGHEFGDILICGLADSLKQEETDICKPYRIGGDEFVVVLESEDAKNYLAITERFKTLLHEKILDEGLKLSVAIGSATGKGKNIESIVKQADENMYENKVAMKNVTK